MLHAVVKFVPIHLVAADLWEAACRLSAGGWMSLVRIADGRLRIADCGLRIRNLRAVGVMGLIVAVAVVVAPAGRASESLLARRTHTLEELKEAVRLGPPRAFVKGNNVRLYFTNTSHQLVFKTDWAKARMDGRAYTYYLAHLALDSGLMKIPDAKSHWREARVFGGDEWLNLAREMAENLTPQEPGQGCYIQFDNTEHVLYRDAAGRIQTTEVKRMPPEVTIERRYNAQEYASAATRILQARVRASGIKQDLFVFVHVPAGRAPRFFMVDLASRRCVLLTLPRIGDDPRGAPHLLRSLRMLISLALESHGVAVLKSPISSVGRVVNTAFQTAAGLLQLPLPSYHTPPPPVAAAPGMDLKEWEARLDRLTGGHPDQGSVRFLIDGERFFPVFQNRLAEATNSIHLRVCIFDTDDVAVEIADQLKQRSTNVDVRVLLDRMSSQASGMAPPATAAPVGFVPPRSISAYLEKGSKVAVRPFLNTAFTADHVKSFTIDGRYAYVGGMNIGREYRYEWHDMMVEVEGPILGPLETDFQRAWAHASLLGDLSYAEQALFGHPPTIQPTAPGLPPLRRLYTRTGELEIRHAELAALRRARNHIFLENSYLYDRAVIAALVRARRRGVDVRVVLPAHCDIGGGEGKTFVTANYLLENGVRVYIYPGMTHVKALLVDGWACFGSANFNKLSLRTNQEMNLATSHPETARQLREQLFDVDFAKAYELTEPMEVSWSDLLAETILDQF